MHIHLSFNLFIWAPFNFIFRIDNCSVMIDWILPEALGCRWLRTIVQPSISSGFMGILFSRMFPWLPSTSHNFRKLPRILRQVHWTAGGRLGGIGLTMMGLSCSCPRETISLLQSCKSHVCRPNNNHLYASQLSKYWFKTHRLEKNILKVWRMNVLFYSNKIQFRSSDYHCSPIAHKEKRAVGGAAKPS